MSSASRTEAVTPDRAPRRAARASLGVVAVAFVLAALAAVPAGAALAGAGGATTVAVPPAPRAVAPTAVAGPAASAPAAVYNPPCYKIDTTVCVSMQSQNESNIIPSTGAYVSNVEPNASSDLVLEIKSERPLNWTPPVYFGPESSIALNVTGVLWNGDPYYSAYDGTIWHANTPTKWWTQLPENTANKTYPWEYTVTLSAKGSNGAPNFYPGMTVRWWIYLTYNVSLANGTGGSTYLHHMSPVFQFTYAGAWPFSPYPGIPQLPNPLYAGSSAMYEDVNLTVAPRAPNFNDSVRFVLNTTQADVLSNATIGPNSYLDLSVALPDGTPIASGAFLFPVSVTAGFGNVTSTVVVPASFAQITGAIVTYTLAVRDTSSDLLVSSPASYVIGTNGSFLSGIFTNDLELTTDPASVAAQPVGGATVAPGQPVNLTLQSRNPGTAISAAQAVYTVSYPLLHETVALHVPFVRVSSVLFRAEVPGLPLGSFVNLSVDAWDFSERLEVSPTLAYFTPDFATAVPQVPANLTFFYVFVYDNGSGQWVNGAKVQIQGTQGVYNFVENSTLGVAYPNASAAPYTPFLVQANASYRVTVVDPWFVPAAHDAPSNVNVTVLALHSMTARQTLAATSNYYVVQEGNAVVFWLNATPPAPAASPTASGQGAVPWAAILGGVASLVVMVPLLGWWRRIRERRKAEEKRVTL